MNTDLARSVTLALACACAAWRTPAAAQQWPSAAADPASIEFFAVGTDGTAVADLQATDFALKVSGRTRIIRSVQWISSGY